MEGRTMYALTFSFDNTDPKTYGPYNTRQEAEDAVWLITGKWSEREIYHNENGGGFHVNKMEKK